MVGFIYSVCPREIRILLHKLGNEHINDVILYRQLLSQIKPNQTNGKKVMTQDDGK